MVFQVSALPCYAAVQLVDNVHDNGVTQRRHQPEIVGTVPCKKPTLQSKEQSKFEYSREVIIITHWLRILCQPPHVNGTVLISDIAVQVEGEHHDGRTP